MPTSRVYTLHLILAKSPKSNWGGRHVCFKFREPRGKHKMQKRLGYPQNELFVISEQIGVARWQVGINLGKKLKIEHLKKESLLYF